MVKQSVHSGAGEQRVGKQPSQFIDIAIAGNDQRTPLIALANDFVQVEGLVTGERSQAEVIQHQDVELGEAG